MHLDPKALSPEVIACLCERPWHGNVRELQNTVRRLTVFCPGNQVEMVHLRLAEGRLSGPGGTWPGDGEDAGGERIDAYKEAKARVLNEFTRNYLERLLARTGGNISEAARLAGLERVSLQKIIKRNGAASASN
jgi:DNA-binding NtrC family response regulator